MSGDGIFVTEKEIKEKMLELSLKFGIEDKELCRTTAEEILWAEARARWSRKRKTNYLGGKGTKKLEEEVAHEFEKVFGDMVCTSPSQLPQHSRAGQVRNGRAPEVSIPYID